MIIGIVGTMDDFSNVPIRGNGKTATLTYIGYTDFLKGREIFSNFEVDFLTYNHEAKKEFLKKETWEQEELLSRIHIMSVQEITDTILNSDIGKFPNGATVLITEIQTVLNSLGEKSSVIKFVDKMVSQTRKRRVDIYYDTQRYGNVHKRLRVQTDEIFIPTKIHKEEYIKYGKINECYIDSCDKDHLIIISQFMYGNNCIIIDATKVGEMYNTDEIINEEFKI